MIHAICDFCGKDAGLSATLITLTPFQNFARHQKTTTPYGVSGTPKSFVICAQCAAAKHLPNPYHDYIQLTNQNVEYSKTLENYTDADLQADISAETAETKG